MQFHYKSICEFNLKKKEFKEKTPVRNIPHKKHGNKNELET